MRRLPVSSVQIACVVGSRDQDSGRKQRSDENESHPVRLPAFKWRQDRGAYPSVVCIGGGPGICLVALAAVLPRRKKDRIGGMSVLMGRDKVDRWSSLFR